MSGNSVSPIRAPQDTPEILAWLHLPFGDDTPMPSSFKFTTRRNMRCKLKLTVESTPEADSPAQAVVTTEEPLAPYKARIEGLSSRRQSYRAMARARKAHEGARSTCSSSSTGTTGLPIAGRRGPIRRRRLFDFNGRPKLPRDAFWQDHRLAGRSQAQLQLCETGSLSSRGQRGSRGFQPALSSSVAGMDGASWGAVAHL